MRSDKITNGAGAALLAFVLMTNGYSVMLGANAGRSTWISHLLATALFFVCAVFLVRVCDAYPQKSFFGALSAVLGRVPAKIIAAAVLIASVATCVVSLTVFSRFVQITALPRTPQIIIPLIIAVISALSLRVGMRALAGSARMLVWFFAGVFLIFVLFGIKWMDAELLLPQTDNPGELLSGTGEVFLNRFGSLFAVMAIYTRMPEGKKRRFAFLTSAIGSGLALTAISAVTVATLGVNAARSDFYPVFTVMSVRGIGGFIQHTEILACIAMTLCLFFKTAVCVMFSDDMLAGILDTTQDLGAAMPIALICAALTQIIYRDLSSLRGMVEWKTGATYVLGAYILIPVLLVLFLKSRIGKQGKTG
ncbi:MAG: GerAB/ArcD/ProY family transporter [Oscillospiraceae bacterium]|nr:GerAB/ArcD/ProY family transporter [Oscillospiraceae bacterium]